uniref:Retinal-specific ATP-binding cassette transporter (inferred by orthology to a human protein) n=1 Tax=Strongyloides venezuelensis TaxID=75913 RepID=A0A0K0FV07_STRVS
MFIVLTIVRTFVENIPNPFCHYDAKGLPSAGIQPVIDGLLVSAKNPCRAFETSGADVRYINTTILKSDVSSCAENVLKLLKSIGEWENIGHFTEQDLEDLFEIKNLNKSQNIELSFLSEKIKKFKVSSNGEVYDFSNKSKISQFISHLGVVSKKSVLNYTKVRRTIVIDSERHTGYDALANRVRDTIDIEDFVNERLLKSRTEDRTICGGFKLPSFSKCKYYRYFDELTEKIKPLAAGYILITPKNNESEIIYDKLNEGLSQLSDIVEYIKYFIKNKELIKKVLNNSSINKIIEILGDIDKDYPLEDMYKYKRDSFNGGVNHGGLFSDPSFTDMVVDDIYSSLTEEFRDFIPCLNFDRIKFVKNESEMEDKAFCLQKYNMYYMGIVLHNSSIFNTTEYSSYNFTVSNDSVIYSIRPVNYLIDTDVKVFSKQHVRDLPRNDYTQDLKYFTSGFIYFQDIIDRILIKQKTKLPIPKFGIYTQQEPSPCVLSKSPFDVSYNISLCFVAAFIFTFGLLVKNVVSEKESSIVDMMYINGLPEILHYIAYSLDAIVVNSLISVLICFMLVYGQILSSVNFLGLYIPLVFYLIATTSQVIIICSICKNSNYASGLTAFIYIMAFMPSALHAIGDFGLSYIYFIFPQSTFGSLIEIYVNSYPGNSPLSEYYKLQLFTGLYYWHAYVALVLDVIGYTVIAFIIIPLLKTFEYSKLWICIVQKIFCYKENVEKDDFHFSIVEDVPNDCIRTVQVHNLVVKYSNGVYGLNGITMNFYSNQVTAFLGHNGAGKSTLVKVLSGMRKATSGHATIYGKDSRYEMNEIRRMIGICPQENVLFPCFTVYEHFTFFGGLLDIPTKKLDIEINNILYDTDLIFKKDCLAKNLSGGMKRKLCMGLALLGDSKLIILDEPTSGVDPLQRKYIWDLIFKIKEGRTIILSTHYMDEAETLSDRIIVMKSGAVFADGTIKFLKEQLGNEIYLKIRKKCIDECKDVNYQEFISEYCTVQKCSPLYIYYRIRHEKNELIPNLLSYLKKNIGQSSDDFQLYMQDFQDFFLKLSEKNNSSDTNTISTNVGGDVTSSETADDVFQLAHPEFKEETDKIKLFWARYFVLLKKRYYLLKNEFFLEMIQRTLPLITIILSLLYSTVIDKRQIYEASKTIDSPLNVDISVGLNYYSLESYLSYNEHKEDFNFPSSNSTIKYLIKSPGLGNYCTTKRLDNDYNLPAYASCDGFKNQEDKAISTIIDKESTGKSLMSSSTCSCNVNFWNCSLTNFNISTPTFVIQPNITLKDYSSIDISKARIGQPDNYGKYVNGSISNFMIGGYQFFLKNNLSRTSKDKFIEEIGFQRLKSILPTLLKLANVNISYLIEHQKYNLSKIHYPIDFLVQTLINNFAEEKVGKIWFNNRYYISSTSFLNSLSTAMLRENYEKQGKQYNNTGVFTIKHAMVGVTSQARRDFEYILASGVVSLGILFSLTMSNAGNVKLLITERTMLIDELIRCSGTGRFVYWFSYFTFDYFLYILCSILILLICFLFNAAFIVYNMKCFIGVTTVFLLFGLNYILSTYITQHLYTDPVKGYIGTGLLSFFLGSMFQVVFVVIQKLANNSDQFKIMESICLYLFSLCPQFNVNMTIFKTLMYSFTMKKLENSLLKEDNLTMNDIFTQPTLYNWDQLPIHMVMLSITFIMRIVLLSVIDNGFGVFPLLKTARKWYLKNTLRNELLHKNNTHPTVLNEESIVRTIDLNTNSSMYGVVCNNISKFYSYNKVAVKDISLFALKGECLGFLGTNGAGKSTTFYMLTNKLQPDIGKARSFGSYSYCPQIHSLNDSLTPRNHLTIYGLLRGIPEESINKIVEWVLQQMSLKDYADKLSKDLSGGNKRKLQTGIAIIGNPNIIYLDEPTSGMDPKSQTFIWNVIEKLRKLDKTIIMCSHSMEECEIVCQKICIMVDGRIKIIGTMQSLKNELGFQYMLRIKVKDASTSTICNIIESHVVTASKYSVQHTFIKYTLKYYENIFEDLLIVLEKLSKQNSVVDYHFRPVNLDDIFSVVADDYETGDM